MLKSFPITLIFCIGLSFLHINGFAQSSAEAADINSSTIDGEIAGNPFRWRLSVDNRQSSASFSTITPGVYWVRITAFANDQFARADSMRLEFQLVREADDWTVN
ncbi:MAG: hypothetical protein AAGJ52_07245, partial [Pseudomonadota bacterium]